MKPKALVIGAGGKIGSAVARALSADWEVLPVTRRDVDAEDLEAIEQLVNGAAPSVVVNAVVFGGIDACEVAPERAFRVNTLLPRRLAALAAERGFRLVHFSSDAVFPDCPEGAFHTESSPAVPPNLYGASKFAADTLLAASGVAIVLRLSVMFGDRPGNGQFLERMLGLALSGRQELLVSSDVVVSPSYSRDVAAGVRDVLSSGLAPGVYHLANEGSVSLYELTSRAVRLLDLPTVVRPVSHTYFPGKVRRSLRTPIRSVKIPPLRPWSLALEEYCRELSRERESSHGQ